MDARALPLLALAVLPICWAAMRSKYGEGTLLTLAAVLRKVAQGRFKDAVCIIKIWWILIHASCEQAEVARAAIERTEQQR